MRWDMNSGSQLTTWTTANNLHSDDVQSMYEVANQLMLASEDAGLARYDWNSGFWLSTWNSGNWLTSDNVQGISVSGNLLAILNGASVQTYDINSAVFLQTYQLADWGLFNDGQEILLWPSVGFRSPVSEIMLAVSYTHLTLPTILSV